MLTGDTANSDANPRHHAQIRSLSGQSLEELTAATRRQTVPACPLVALPATACHHILLRLELYARDLLSYTHLVHMKYN